MKRIAAKLVAGASAAFLLLVALAAFLFRHQPYKPDPAPVVKARGLKLRYTGISGYELTDGKTTLLLDPVVTRPRIWEILLGPLKPDEALAAKVFPKANFILLDHAHYDHAIDAPSIALRTGAVLVGSKSACNLARSRGVPPAQLREVAGGETLSLGSFTVRVARSRHIAFLGQPRIMSGLISEKAGPLWFHQYVQDAALAFRLESAGRSVWFHPTSTYAPHELLGLDADTFIVGVNGEKLTPEKLSGMASEAPGVRLFIPTHFDNFFQPLSLGLALMPGVDMRAVRRLAAAAMPKAAYAELAFDQTMELP